MGPVLYPKWGQTAQRIQPQMASWEFPPQKEMLRYHKTSICHPYAKCLQHRENVRHLHSTHPQLVCSPLGTHWHKLEQCKASSNRSWSQHRHSSSYIWIISRKLRQEHLGYENIFWKWHAKRMEQARKRKMYSQESRSLKELRSLCQAK